MAEFKIFHTISSRMACRGGEKACIGVKKNSYSNLRIIPKGSKVLSISVWGAGGGSTAYYCEVCMIPVLDAMHAILKGNVTEEKEDQATEDDS